jgi:hypothetical protein
MTRYVKEEELGKLYKFDELKNLGVKIGDIVAYRSTRLDEGYCWEYVLLKEDFPNNLDVALQCYKDPRTPHIMCGASLGYHWCGSLLGFDFRLINEKEKDDFLNAFIARLSFEELPNRGFDFMDDDYKCQVIHAIKKYGLLPKKTVDKLNQALQKKFNINLLKLYTLKYGH